METQRRRVVVEVDEAELEWAALSSKCSPEQFIASAIACALIDEVYDDAEAAEAHVVVDGAGLTVKRSAAPDEGSQALVGEFHNRHM